MTSHRPSLSLLIGVLLAFLVATRPEARSAAFRLIRLPYTVTAAVVRSALLLPAMPAAARDLERLRAALAQRDIENAQLKERLKRLADRAELEAAAGEARGVLARVVARSPVPTQQTVLIDKGQRDGLSLDTPVLNADGAVGRVIELHFATAQVALLTDADSRVAARLERTQETGLLIGTDTGLCELQYLDDEADIQKGDRLLTAGLGGPFPEGLVLGEVVDVARDAVSGSAVARVRPAAKLGRLENVLCVLAPPEAPPIAAAVAPPPAAEVPPKP